MSADEDMLEWVGLWECGNCHALVSETHFYMDRATGRMQHAAEPYVRERLAALCGWRFDDDYGTVVRCAFPVGHGGEHKSAGSYPIRWDDGHFAFGAIAPFDSSSANRVAVRPPEETT